MAFSIRLKSDYEALINCKLPQPTKKAPVSEGLFHNFPQ